MNPVTFSDIAARWRALTDAEESTATAKLADAWAILTAKVPDFQARVQSGAIPEDLLRLVICEAVIAVMQNPEGYLEEAVDDWRGRRDSATSTGRLFFTDDALALLMPAEAASKAFTITPGY